MSKEYFTAKPPFINRVAERDYLLNYFHAAPANIMFVYGPKSTGKSTLIKRVTDELDSQEYKVNYVNLRMILLQQFEDFKNLFFPKTFKQEVGETIRQIVLGTKVNIFGFSWTSEDLKLMESNLFGVMEKKIREGNEEGVKTVIVLDEFQYLKDIFIDDKKEIYLIDELFKFFIGITKQFHLAHVVCLTSDSYFLEELYNDTKLANTSDFYMMEHLSQEDIYFWLGEKEQIEKSIVEDIWNNLGGSVWEIWQVFVQYKNTGDYKNKLEDLLTIKYSLVAEWYSENIEKGNEQNIESFVKIISGLVKNGVYQLSLTEGYSPLIKDLVSKDIWFYNAKKREITPNSESVKKAFERMLQELK